MVKSIAYSATVLALVGTLAMVSPAKADERQVSGIAYSTQVESHFVPEGGDPTRGFGIEKFAGAVTSPGWFDAMQETLVVSSRLDLKAGRAEDKAVSFWRNADGTLKVTIVGKAAFTMDEKTNAAKGTGEGTFEIVEGTGRFANTRGHGTYKSEFNAGNATVHWNATITGFEKQTSAQ